MSALLTAGNRFQHHILDASKKKKKCYEGKIIHFWCVTVVLVLKPACVLGMNISSYTCLDYEQE